jgi:AraC-like DNA-binding protein/quercetin dioxygenase-like cupin family protein
MLKRIRKPVWEDAYAVIEPRINASGVHEWPFSPGFPIDLRYFVMRREADIRMNHHSYFEVLYLASGEVEYQVCDRFYKLKEGDLFVMGGALPHRMARYGRSQIKCVTLYFEPEIIRAHDSSGDDLQYLMPFLVQHSGFPHVVPSETGTPAQVLDFMKRIHSELPADSARARLTVRTYLKMVLVLLVNHYSEFRDSQPMLSQKQRNFERLQPLFEYIEQNYMSEIPVSRAARVVNMSKSHFMRFFKQVTGQPFVTHLNQFRVAKAQQLISTTDRTIADIGQEVGFCNQSYFGLVFRRLTHLSPREYKMKLASEDGDAREEDSRIGTRALPLNSFCHTAFTARAS